MKSNLSWFALFLNKIILTKMQIWDFWSCHVRVERDNGFAKRASFSCDRDAISQDGMIRSRKQTPNPIASLILFRARRMFFPVLTRQFRSRFFFTLVYFILSCNWIGIFHEKNATKKTHSTYSFHLKKASQKSTGTITQHSVTVSSMSRKACSVTSPNRDCGTIDVALFGLPINLRNALNNVKYKERNWANTVIILSFAQVTNPIYN